MNNQKTVGIVNQVGILLIENGEKLIPIRPICEALGVDVESQRKKIKDDFILCKVWQKSRGIGADGKEREMFCLPLKYIFGWLFTINPKNVKEEAREAVLKNRNECYNMFFNLLIK